MNSHGIEGKKLIWALGGILLVLCAACGGRTPGGSIDIRAAGDLVTENYDLDGFDEVEVSTFFEADIVQGSEFLVVVEAERALLPYLRVEVRGGVLRVGLDEGFLYNFEDASQRVEVTLPMLSRASVANHSTIRVDGIETEDTLRLEVADFSTLNGTITAGMLEIDVSNHSTLIVSGSTSRVSGGVADFSDADLTQLDVDNVDVEVGDKSSLRQ
jgi:hypothetical protein